MSLVWYGLVWFDRKIEIIKLTLDNRESSGSAIQFSLRTCYFACTAVSQTPIKTNKTTRGRRTRLTTAEETDIDSTDEVKENVANNVKRQTRTRAGGSKKRFYHK